MEHKNSQIYVLMGGVIQTVAKNMEEVEQFITEEIQHKEEHGKVAELSGIRLLNVIGELGNSFHGDFEVIVDRKDPEFGEEYETMNDRVNYLVDGHKFDSMEDLQSWVKEKHDSGYYTTQEVKELDIEKRVIEDVSFLDFKPGDPEARLQLQGEGIKIADNFGRQYIRADQAEEYVQATTGRKLNDPSMDLNFKEMFTAQHKHPAEMTNDEIERAKESLHRRIKELGTESHVRRGIING